MNKIWEWIIVNAVRLIRKHYSTEVPIVLLADTGFFDEVIFKLCNELECFSYCKNIILLSILTGRDMFSAFKICSQ